MAEQIQWRAYGDTSIQTIVPQLGDIIIHKPAVGKPKIHVGDGDKIGGHPLALESNLTTSFTSSDGKKITIENGVVTGISPVDFIESQMFDLTT
jgi:hypothetical protein